MTPPLLIAEPPFQVPPALAGIVGFDEAAVLQVINYWLDPQVNTYIKQGRHWVPNLYFPWAGYKPSPLGGIALAEKFAV